MIYWTLKMQNVQIIFSTEAAGSFPTFRDLNGGQVSLGSRTPFIQVCQMCIYIMPN